MSLCVCVRVCVWGVFVKAGKPPWHTYGCLLTNAVLIWRGRQKEMNSDPQRDSTVHVGSVDGGFVCVCVHGCEDVCSLCPSVSGSVHDVHTNEGFGYTPLLEGLHFCISVNVCFCLDEKDIRGRRGTGN